MNQPKSTCNTCLIDCFNQNRFKPNELDIIEKAKKEIVFKKGETILKQDSFVNEVFFIKDGLAKMERVEENKREMIIDFIGPGNNIGLSLYDAEEAPFNIVALSETRVCLLKSTAIKYFIKTNPAYNEYLLEWYRQNTLRQFNRLYMVGTKQMHGKFASLLFYVIERSKTGVNIFEHITRKELACFIGISIERMNHIIAELKNDGIIAANGKSFEILDMEKYMSIVRNG